MPKIKITEKDLTSSGLSVAADNVVYIPGPAVTGANATAPVLCTSIDELTAAAKDYNYEKTSLSFRLAKYLVNNLGLYVLYEGLDSTAIKVPEDSWKILEDKTGYDIRFLTTGQYGYVDTNEIACAKNRGDTIALVDHPSDIFNTTSYNYELLTSAEKPDDWKEDSWPEDTFFELVSTYTEVTGTSAPEFKSNTYYLKVVVPESSNPVYIVLTEKPADWDKIYTQTFTRKDNYTAISSYVAYEKNKYYRRVAIAGVSGNALKARNSLQTAGSSEYAAAFTPWFTSSIKELQKDNEAEVLIPPSFGYLFAYARMIQNNDEWNAVAGSSNGIISELLKTQVNYSNADCEILQARSVSKEVELDADGDNVGIAYNPIAPIRPFGTIIWGNRTMLDNTVIDGLKATSFLNIRNLVCTIKKVLYKAARTYTFAQNNDTLWFNFKNAIIPTLENMKSGNGILGYRLTQVQTNKKARLKAYLVIVPIEAVEDFEIDIELNDSLQIEE